MSGVTQNIVGLLPPNSLGSNNNLLFASGPLLSNNGFSFTVNGAGNDGNRVNVFYNVRFNTYTEFSNSVGFGTFSVTPVAIPTPALLPSLIGLGVAALRKRKSESETLEPVNQG